MRSNYNILWLDDDFDNDTAVLRRLVEQTEKYLQGKGYIPKIIKVSNKETALYEINSNKKIDLFLSDYNIENDDTFSGFDFLIATRKKYKQEMLLYSNQDEIQIKNYLLNYLGKDSTPLTYFSKFLFESANNKNLLLNSIKELIDLTLLRWNELNALRGLYLSETSQVHHDAKEYIKNNIPNIDLYNNFIGNYHGKQSRMDEIADILEGTDTDISKIDFLEFYEVQCILSDDANQLYNDWNEIRDIRNGCAHVVQSNEKNSENFIRLMNKKRLKIKESEIDKYRVKLLNFIDDYYESYPLPEEKSNMVET